jgi:SAM-dependent methyltransferase
MSGWDDPAVAEYYEAFCRRHSRYIEANAALVARAAIGPGMRVLDLGAGTGRTADAILPLLGAAGQIVCVEPAAAMLSRGERRVADRRVTWRCDLPNLPNEGARFDRILSGAAIWQLAPREEWIRRLSALLAPGGALCFNVPAMYLCEPDEPGGGRDPWLLELPALLAAGTAAARSEGANTAGANAAGSNIAGANAASNTAGAAPDDGAALSRESQTAMTRRAWTALLRSAQLRSHSWSFRYRLTQPAYADWLKIPVLTERLLAGVDPVERARRIDRALAAASRDSWKWERWRGWTAWKH